MIPAVGGTVRRWSLFCRVVDNFGDIGVCWRLARTLAAHHRQVVTLWVDDLGTMRRLCPSLLPDLDAQQLDGVLVRRWKPPFGDVVLDDVVIEAFACELPDEILTTMAGRRPAPVWINLEYLSAEDWIESCHRLSSPHPVLPLTRYFFFPGFSAASGGLLCEPGLFARRDAFQADVAVRRRWFAERLGRAPVADARVISLFAYEQPGLGALLERWAAGGRAVELLVPEGRVVADVARHFGRVALAAGDALRDRALHVSVLPFSTQDEYDRLLWACDLNFVRGEDSFVRAQWAARPLVWHIYRQDDDAHRVKLEAFLARFLRDADPAVAGATAAFWRAWNGFGDVATAWPDFEATLPALHAHCVAWCGALAAHQDLASSLLNFSETSV